MNISRSKAALQGAEALEIIKTGSYALRDGTRVSVRDELKRARENTRSYRFDAPLPKFERLNRAGAIEVSNETTLAATKRLVEAGLRPLALNFASARNPGGGFLSGARAQEESLCRCSGLFACLENQPFYAHHRAEKSFFYSDWMLLSPNVPVWRDEVSGELVPFWSASFLTAPAPNFGAMQQHHQNPDPDELRQAFERRIRKICVLALAHNYDALVLGAWGCGAFRNDPKMVARAFRTVLDEFETAFERIVFAVFDRGEERRFIGPFEKVFAPD